MYVFFYSSLANDLHLTESTELGNACVCGEQPQHTASRVWLCSLLFYRKERERISTLGGSVCEYNSLLGMELLQGFWTRTTTNKHFLTHAQLVFLLPSSAPIHGKAPEFAWRLSLT